MYRFTLIFTFFREVLKFLDYNVQRRIQNPVKHLKRLLVKTFPS